jgi:hypothetical protein
MSRPHYIRHKNAAYDPYEARPEEIEWTRCAVCGWYLDGSITSEPTHFAGIQLIETGSQRLEVGMSVEDLADIDFQVEPRVVAGCPFCSSGRWRDGNGLEGLTPPL